MTNIVLMFGILAVLIIVLFILVEVKIGKYVLKDTRLKNYSRNYQIAWVIVSVFIPYFLGFGIYLISRNYIPNKRCTNCQHRLNSNMVYCPYCGEKQEKETSPVVQHALGLKQVMIWVISLVVLLLVSFVGFVIYSYFNPELINRIYEIEQYFETKHIFLR